MKTVSAAWMENIYASTRQTKVTITFPFVDPDAKDAAVVEQTPPGAEISKADQIVDNQYDLVGRLAQFEPEYWRLDGSFILPLPEDTTLSQYGYWSEILSDENGEFPDEPVLRLFFTRPITIPGMTILFDNATGNFLTDFDCIAYDQDMNILRREEVRGNTSARYVLDKGVVALKYIDIIFLKTNIPRRRARITEIDFGIMLIFEGSNLLSINLISEVDPLSQTIPSNELNFSAINNGSFDYTNPESYAKYLQRRQQFEYRHSVLIPGAATETIDMGVYSLLSWNVTDKKIDLKAKLDLSALEEHPFRRYSLNRQMTCGALMELIFEDAGWTDYEIEPALYDSPMLTPYTGEVSNKEALRMVAQLAGAVVYKMPSGKIIVRRMSFDPAPTPIDTIDYDNSYTETAAKSSKYYNAINLTVTTVAQKDTPQDNPIVVFRGVPKEPGVEEEFIVGFDYVLYDDDPAISIESGVITQSEIYANYAFLRVSAPGEFTVTISGKTVDFNSSADLVYYAPWFQDGEELHTYKLKLPMMIQGEQYQTLRDWAVTERFRVLGYRLTTESNWRQNPALDIGDPLAIQMDKSDERIPIIAVKHAIKFKGGTMKGTTTGIGQGQLITNT